jgi:hypothetical protein
MRRLTFVFASLAFALAGCGGEQSWTIDSSWQGEEGSRRQTSRLDPYENETHTLAPAAGPAPDAVTWFGVRHDLSMKPGTPRQAACGCIALESGMPGKQAFLWAGDAPSIGSDAVVVAISVRGVECPAEPDEEKRRASISGVERDGDDVIIEVEELPEGRPLALGAIIPKPGANGGLFLKPRDKKVRYLPQGADKRCRVKSPTAAGQAQAPSGAP